MVAIQRITYRALFFGELLKELTNSFQLLVPFFLFKELGASLFEISFLAMLRPTLSLFAPYWPMKSRPLAFQMGVAEALSLIAFLPFCLFPTKELLILASAFYVYFQRVATAPWMEMLKINLSQEERQISFAKSMRASYGFSVLLGLILGVICDSFPSGWVVIIGAALPLSIASIFLRYKMPLAREASALCAPPCAKTGIELLKTRKDFAAFQWGFMFAGMALMLIPPMIPSFLQNELKLSYLEISVAKLGVQSVGFILFSSWWARFMEKKGIFIASAITFLTMCLLPLFLLGAKSFLPAVYLAYFAYGLSQAGSRLVWNMAGPYFAKDEQSQSFTRLSIWMVGWRGLFTPFLGALLASFFDKEMVLTVSLILCLAGALWMVFWRAYDPQNKLQESRKALEEG